MTSARSDGRNLGHAQLMDDVYRHQRHIYDVTRKYYLLGRDRLIRGLDIPDGGRVLEIGCGTGRNLVVAARRNPQALFYGVDISRHMLENAAASARRAGVEDRVFTLAGDAETIDACENFGVAGFDRVFFSYSLSMVPEWRRALATGLEQLAHGGSLHVIDFGQMERWPSIARTAMLRWLAYFHVSPRSRLTAETGQLGLSKGFDVQSTDIAAGYATLIVLYRTGPSRGLHENQS